MDRVWLVPLSGVLVYASGFAFLRYAAPSDRWIFAAVNLWMIAALFGSVVYVGFLFGVRDDSKAAVTWWGVIEADYLRSLSEPRQLELPIDTVS